MRRIVGVVAALLLGLPACMAERVTIPPALTFAPDAWSGGTLMLRSPLFRGVDSLPIVMVGAATLAVRSAWPDSVLVALPDTDGMIALSIRLVSGDATMDSVRVHGFVSLATAPGPAVDAIAPWPRGGATALGFQGGRLVLLDYRLGTSTPLTPDTGLGHGCQQVPVPSATEEGLVAIASLIGGGGNSSTCAPLIAVPVAPSAAAPDTGPQPYSIWPAMHLKRGHWLVSFKYDFRIFRRDAPGAFTELLRNVACSQPEGFTISPRRDRIVPVGCYAAAGVPVFDPRTPGVAYVLAALQYTETGDFSDAGDTLFQVGGDTLGLHGLFAIDAATGHVLAANSFEVYAYDVRLDPGGKWIYVAGAAGGTSGPPIVAVYDRSTLARVATLREPAGTISVPVLRGDLEILFDAAGRRLYLALNDTRNPVQVLQFDLMP